MQKIELKNIKIYAYHGCMEEEAIVGSFYLVNLIVWLDLSEAGKTDNLEQTVNYGELTQIVKDQMAIRSNLLENLAYRILTEIENKYKSIKKARVSVSKINPPVNADLDEVKVTFEKNFSI
ncbi:dihydroneopterin aldolase [Apibacter raozihei]|uniref:dihydroneopterin aldolase n=1 Tax=Apibacter TaxID=1778601 RepID=UPI000FE2DAB8|nr:MULTISPECIES: dihydroneopterin aldolase [Apibacter]